MRIPWFLVLNFRNRCASGTLSPVVGSSISRFEAKYLPLKFGTMSKYSLTDEFCLYSSWLPEQMTSICCSLNISLVYMPRGSDASYKRDVVAPVRAIRRSIQTLADYHLLVRNLTPEDVRHAIRVCLLSEES